MQYKKLITILVILDQVPKTQFNIWCIVYKLPINLRLSKQKYFHIWRKYFRQINIIYVKFCLMVVLYLTPTWIIDLLFITCCYQSFLWDHFVNMEHLGVALVHSVYFCEKGLHIRIANCLNIYERWVENCGFETWSRPQHSCINSALISIEFCYFWRIHEYSRDIGIGFNPTSSYWYGILLFVLLRNRD